MSAIQVKNLESSDGILILEGDNMVGWEWIEAVQRMQDYIEQHIAEKISLRDLADAASYSPWHSARIFKELTGMAPFEYIRALRLSKAAVRLLEPDSRVADVAFDFVFDSHEGFTRAFSKQFGMSPRDYVKEPSASRLFMPGRIRDDYLTKQKGEIPVMKNNTNTVFVQVIEKPARRLILKRGVNAADYYEYCEEVGCEVWDVLTGIKEAINEPMGMWLPDSLRTPGTSVYVQGVEVPVEYEGSIPEGSEMIGLKPCKVMVFQGQPYEDEKFEEAIGELWEVMNRYNPETYGFQWADEDGPRFQLAPMGYRGYIEGRPVRQLNEK